MSDKEQQYETKYGLGDIVMLRVNNIQVFKIKEFHNIFVKNKNIEVTDRSYGHTYNKDMHTYAIDKNDKRIICLVFTPLIGDIKSVYPKNFQMEKNPKSIPQSYMDAYLIKWQERNMETVIGGFSRGEEVYYEENLISFKEIERFLTRQEMIEYCVSISF